MITFPISYTNLSVCLRTIFGVSCNSSITEKGNTDWPTEVPVTVIGMKSKTADVLGSALLLRYAAYHVRRYLNPTFNSLFKLFDTGSLK